MKILVTGGTGFIGKALLQNLIRHPEYEVLGSTRTPSTKPSIAPLIPVGPSNSSTDWSAALQEVDVVIHVAAHLNIRSVRGINPRLELRTINVEGTLALARQALAAGASRFIFISSLGVNGTKTTDAPFDELSPPAPADDYARSKLEAEQTLQDLLQGTAMDLVIIRPPLVYAANAPRNFPRLMSWVFSDVPMPFGRVNNRRSMIALDNLVDFIALCIRHPAAANQLFLISDGRDMSTAEIAQHLAGGMGRKVRLLPVPDTLLYWGAKLLGKGAMYSTLCGSLRVDSSKARRLLGWTPRVSPEVALFKSGRDFLSNANSLPLSAQENKGS